MSLKADTAVLIITERYDVHGDALIWALGQTGVRCDRWALSEYPENQQSSVRISNSPSPPFFQIPGLADNYQSIWLRRLAEPTAISASLAAADVPMASIQARRCCEGIRAIFSPESVWVNPLNSRQTANAKPVQLLAARRAGLQIPETLISNEPDEIRRFHREHGGDVVCKFFTPAYWRHRTNGTVSSVFTARLKEELLEEDGAFTSCPAIYQTLVPKKADVRITFFGSSYYAVRIWSQQSSSGAVDFRSDMLLEAPMTAMELDPKFQEQCMELSLQLGLLHGSYDFVEQPDGSLTFLEVNEMGQFLWLEERVPELPLLAAFAAFSLNPNVGFRFDSGHGAGHSFHEFRKSEAFELFSKDMAVSTASSPFEYLE